jgi:acetyl-CoA C-acetyltransferase
VLAGTFDLDGELPVNPDGGLKSFGHPIGASPARMLFECWLQLRGEAGERQIASVAAGRPRRSPTTSAARRARA